jgi:diguanylate cyclase (GGDEF)-like protein
MVNVSGEDCIHFRYSGDKFVVVCKAQDVIRAKETAEKIREGFQKIAFRNNESREHITVSVGIVDISYGDAKNAEQIVSIAEHALTTAKNSGKNRVCAYKERNYPR